MAFPVESVTFPMKILACPNAMVMHDANSIDNKKLKFVNFLLMCLILIKRPNPSRFVYTNPNAARSLLVKILMNPL